MTNKVSAAAVQKITGVRTFEIVQYVSGFMPGELEDWPNNIQDRILDALERKSKEVELPLTIVHSRCDVDYGETKAQDRYYVHIIASEIVAADSRFIRDEKEKMKELIADMVAGRTKH